jgi:serine protease Do
VTTLLLAAAVCAADPVTDLVASVGPKLVKLFGAGGFRGVSNYGVGVLVSADGFVLTAAGPMLDTPDLTAHLADGRRLPAKLVATEPLLDLAVVKLGGDRPSAGLPCFDLARELVGPPPQPGDWVFGFGNMFEIAMRDEPLTVQHGVIAAVAPLTGRRGTFDYDFPGPVLVVDAITNNPGAAGGPLLTRAGRLVGLIGREVKNAQTETWVNYAIPLTARVPAGQGGATVGVPEFVAAAVAGKYTPVARPTASSGPAGDHGIVLVPNLLDRTPPYVERVRPNSPAAAAGLKPDDLVAFVDGVGVSTVKAFEQNMLGRPPGSKVRLDVRRGGALVKVELTLVPPPRPAGR